MKQYKPVFIFVVSGVIISFVPSLAFSVYETVLKQSLPPEYASNQIIVKFRETAASTVEEQVDLQIPVGQMKLSKGLDELNARYKIKKIEPLCKNFKANRQQFEAIQQKSKTQLTQKEKHLLTRLARAPQGVKIPDLNRFYKIQVELTAGQRLEDAVAECAASPDVEYAELNYIVSINLTPNDPLYPQQWALSNISAPEAWDIHRGSSDIIVAVVDTGVDYTHRDLDDNMWGNELELNGTDGVDDDDNGYVDDIYGYDFCTYGGETRDSDPIDDHGHGSHCSGIIAAEGNNASDIAGVCWRSSIMALKFLDSGGDGYVSDAVDAFYYAVANGADVLSNSWGGGGYSQTMAEVIDFAHSQGVIVVAAAGNDYSNVPQYPANHDHVLAVAATNSEDEKPGFSNYGSWVDIAAPGVDVLSLRASGTSMGTTYDDYTTIASGTSMACPHIAGACAIILSVYPEIDPSQLEAHLENSTDPIDPDVCASGRLNLNQAIRQILAPGGKVYLDADAYTCSGTIIISLFDSDLAGNITQQVTISTDGGDLETLLLLEASSGIGVFDGTVSVDSDAPEIGDGMLQISHGQIITVTYDDADDGTGTPATATDTALIDCQAPIIFDVQIGYPGRQPTITVETDEPTTVHLMCGLACGGPYIINESDLTLATSHAIELAGVAPETDYFFVIEANDAAGNKRVEDNNGHCYEFTTTSVGSIHVPSQCPTIQGAINNSWDGGIVWVADGTYIGAGNRDLDFKGRAITVSSENGPERCIIDCSSTGTTEGYRGFYFHSGEDTNSVVSGFTITNGSIPGSWYVGIGGGILCVDDSNPTITNCIITGNSAGWDGGGICNLDSSPNINNCTFFANSALGNDGGGINNENSSPTITNCTFTANSAFDWGGAIRSISSSNPVITNCIFTGNTADDGGAMYYFNNSRPVITNCTFAGNLAQYGNAMACDSWGYLNNIELINSILSDGDDEIWNSDSSIIKITYSDVYGGWAGQGNINLDPRFVDSGYWNANGFWVEGDYHLQSQGGHWDSDTSSWIKDGLTSPCIDAGNPNSAWTDEQWPHGTRINMGAYGGAEQASKSHLEPPPIEIKIKLTPKGVNASSAGRWVKAHCVLPEGFTVDGVDIITPATIEPLGIESAYINPFINEDGLVEIEIAFDRGGFCSGVDYGPAEIVIVALLTSGQYFYGTDTIRITIHGLQHVAVLASYWLESDCDVPDWCGDSDLNQDSVVNFVDFSLLNGCCIEIPGR
ncbi:MAG: S8 family serine peptidase [Planctomycetota bacterium]